MIVAHLRPVSLSRALERSSPSNARQTPRLVAMAATVGRVLAPRPSNPAINPTQDTFCLPQILRRVIDVTRDQLMRIGTDRHCLAQAGLRRHPEGCPRSCWIGIFRTV